MDGRREREGERKRERERGRDREKRIRETIHDIQMRFRDENSGGCETDRLERGSGASVGVVECYDGVTRLRLVPLVPLVVLRVNGECVTALNGECFTAVEDS